MTTDAAVRLYPETDLGDLQYPKGKAPAQVATTIVAHGDPGNWPFDTYTTDEISGVVFTGGYQTKVWARMEVTGALDGWDINVRRVHDSEDSENPDSLDNVIITLHRSKGPLIFDLGICLILIALPLLASGWPFRCCWADDVLAAVHHVVRRDVVRHHPATQLPSRQSTTWFVDRPSRGAVGVDRTGRSHGPVHPRLVAASGSKTAEKELIPPDSGDGVDGARDSCLKVGRQRDIAGFVEVDLAGSDRRLQE